MTRLHIVAKRPKQPVRMLGESFPTLQVLPEWHDVEVYALDDDGRAIPLNNVTSLTIVAKPGEPVRAALEMLDVSLDIEAKRTE